MFNHVSSLQLSQCLNGIIGSESQRSRATAQVVQGPFVQAQQDPVVHASDQFIQQRGPHGWFTHHGDLRGSTE